MIKKKWLRRVGAFTLALSMILGCATVSAADEKEALKGNPGVIETGKDVTLTIHKYEMESMNLAGANGDGTTDVTIPEDAKPLGNVTFAVYKVASDTEDTKVPEGANVVEEKTTIADGTAVFTDLEQGRYLVVETKAPDKVYEKCENFLVDLPTMSTDGTSWNYDVHVYPKNAAVVGAVVLTKTDKDTTIPVEGAKFKLQKQDGAAWGDMKDENQATREFTTAKDGTITVTGLLYGSYQFIETAAPEGYGINTTPVPFTITKNATIDQNGKLTANYEKVEAKDVKTPTIGKSANKKSAAIGENVSWTLTLTVPSDISTYQKYEVADTLDSRLKYTDKSLKVFLDDVQISTGFDVDGTNGIKVTFRDFEALNGKTLRITFDTTIDQSAGDDPGNISNKGSVSYTNQYGTSGNPESNEVKVYVGNIRIIKHESGDEKKVLSGAQFALYPSEKDAKNNTNQIGEIQTSDKKGEAYFKGLKEGTYWLVEKVSPTYEDKDTTKHYLLMTAPQELTVSSADEGTVTYKIANKKPGFTIPKTGGAGTLITLFVGLMMVSGATILLTFRKRRAIR